MTTTYTPTDADLILASIAEPGDTVLGRLVRKLGREDTADFIRNASAWPAVLEDRGMRAGLERWQPRIPSTAQLERIRELMARHEIGMIVPGLAEWPVKLADLGDSEPLQIFYRGNVATLQRWADEQRLVAVVGARASTSYGEHATVEIVAGLAQRGWTIVSGGAYGIDGAAHRAALADQVPTVAVLAGGVDRFYPAGHEDLLGRIASDGRSVVVSELPPGSAPTKWRFLQRNRLIAALADATLVVEAGARSGSLNTAGHAAALDRPLFAVPGPITSAASAGITRLLREYDARAVGSALDLAVDLEQHERGE